MQKIMNAKTVGAVHTRAHTPCLYKINVQAKGRNLEKEIVNIDEAKNYEKLVSF